MKELFNNKSAFSFHNNTFAVNKNNYKNPFSWFFDAKRNDLDNGVVGKQSINIKNNK